MSRCRPRHCPISSPAGLGRGFSVSHSPRQRQHQIPRHRTPSAGLLPRTEQGTTTSLLKGLPSRNQVEREKSKVYPTSRFPLAEPLDLISSYPPLNIHLASTSQSGLGAGRIALRTCRSCPRRARFSFPGSWRGLVLDRGSSSRLLRPDMRAACFCRGESVWQVVRSGRCPSVVLTQARQRGDCAARVVDTRVLQTRTTAQVSSASQSFTSRNLLRGLLTLKPGVENKHECI